jgi:L-ascorbate metabolism protein UlaG (beta-lactamase superfamily)
MLLRRLDDYQSWQIAWRGGSILIDPWLTDEPITGVFDRRHSEGFTSIDDLRLEAGRVVGVLLCTAVNDHTRPDTLKQLGDAPIHGPAPAVKIARSNGCTNTHVARVGSTFEFACPEGGSLRVTPTKPGLPLGLIAHGYVIDALDENGTSTGRIWIEPHQPTQKTAERIGSVDVAVLPTSSVTAILLPVTAGLRKSAQAAATCGARAVVPTATDPRRDMKRWQKAIYFVGNGPRSMRNKLVANKQLIDLRPGDWLDATASRS